MSQFCYKILWYCLFITKKRLHSHTYTHTNVLLESYDKLRLVFATDWHPEDHSHTAMGCALIEISSKIVSSETSDSANNNDTPMFHLRITSLLRTETNLCPLSRGSTTLYTSPAPTHLEVSISLDEVAYSCLCSCLEGRVLLSVIGQEVGQCPRQHLVRGRRQLPTNITRHHFNVLR